MISKEELRNMIYSFDVRKLRNLLQFAGKVWRGKNKSALRKTALSLDLGSVHIQKNIVNLHKCRFDVKAPSSIHQASETDIDMPTPSSRDASPYTSARHPFANISNSSTSSNTTPPIVYLKPPLDLTPHSAQLKVRLKPLPFFDVVSSIIVPTLLAETAENKLQFSLTQDQATILQTSPKMKIQVRFCLLSTRWELNDDFPPNISMTVNNKKCELPLKVPIAGAPKTLSKYISGPVDITELCSRSAGIKNDISLHHFCGYSRHVISVNLVSRIDIPTLVSRVKCNATIKPGQTRAKIKQSFKQRLNSGIGTASQTVSLICPLCLVKIETPSRSIACDHLRCFDLECFLQMNERTPKWECPMCAQPATIESLRVDGYFSQILSRVHPDCSKVQLHKNGSWTQINDNYGSDSTEMPYVQREKLSALQQISSAERLHFAKGCASAVDAVVKSLL